MARPCVQHQYRQSALFCRRRRGPNAGRYQLNHVLEVLYSEGYVHTFAAIEESHVRGIVSNGKDVVGVPRGAVRFVVRARHVENSSVQECMLDDLLCR